MVEKSERIERKCAVLRHELIYLWLFIIMTEKFIEIIYKIYHFVSLTIIKHLFIDNYSEK